MASSISIDVLAIIALCFTIIMAKRNIVLNNYKNVLYILAVATTIILLLLEIATIFMTLSSNLVVPHRIVNIMGFALSPLVPFILLLFNNHKKNGIIYNSFLTLPIFFNAFMCILSYKTGWIFFVNAQNQYIRGNLFLLPTIISVFYFVLLAIAIIKNKIEYEKDEKKLLILILFIPVLGVMVQLLRKDVLAIWGSVSISLLLYYIVLRELKFKYDVQTRIKNRSAFEKEMKQYLKGDKNAALVVLDINNLKIINDRYGHKTGDEAIIQAAKIIQESFEGIGRTFRIGGDEFCVICKEVSPELVDNSLSILDQLLIAINQESNIKIVIAHGYAFYSKNESANIYATLAQADRAMYIHKADLKTWV